MKKSSLKSMMSRIIIYSITVLLSSLFCWQKADAQVREKTVCVNRMLFLLYMVGDIKVPFV